MNADKRSQIQAHAQAIAALLYEETDPEQVKTLEGLEQSVRAHILEHISPEIGGFLSKKAVEPKLDDPVASTASLES